MRNLNLTILIILFPLIIFAQNFMTIGEIFDFEIGDEFQIEGRGEYHGGAQPPNADRITIINKYYSLDSNTVFYVRFHDSYYVYIEGWDEEHYYFWTETDTISYTNLDSCITQTDYWKDYDTSMNYFDTIIEFSENYCNTLLNGFEISVNSFESIEYSAVYGKGLGLVEEYHNDAAEYSMYDNVLFYYKKNGVSCGIPDKTVSISEKNLLNDFKIYPTPARDFLRIENKKKIKMESIYIINVNGQIVKQFNAKKSTFDISDISPGFYFLKIRYKNGELNKKIIIE